MRLTVLNIKLVCILIRILINCLKCSQNQECKLRDESIIPWLPVGWLLIASFLIRAPHTTAAFIFSLFPIASSYLNQLYFSLIRACEVKTRENRKKNLENWVTSLVRHWFNINLQRSHCRRTVTASQLAELITPSHTPLALFLWSLTGPKWGLCLSAFIKYLCQNAASAPTALSLLNWGPIAVYDCAYDSFAFSYNFSYWQNMHIPKQYSVMFVRIWTLGNMYHTKCFDL